MKQEGYLQNLKSIPPLLQTRKQDTQEGEGICLSHIEIWQALGSPSETKI